MTTDNSPLANKKILLVTYGSYGDLFPYLAIARAVSDHGALVTILTHPQYEANVREQGHEFVAIPPGPEHIPNDPNWAARFNAPIRGLEYMLKQLILPHFLEAERILREAAVGQDLIITHFLTFFAPAVAESLGIPWLSCALSPSVLFSAHDPPALEILPFLPSLRILGPSTLRRIYDVLAHPSWPWFNVLHEQRRRLNLAPLTEHPLFRYASPSGTLALFPPEFAAPQPDWPTCTRQVGFPIYNEAGLKLSAELTAFLDAGSEPIVFTLGTAISLMRTDFFAVAARATRGLKRRAVFVIGKDAPADLRIARDADIFVTPYEPFGPLFAAASVIVHHAGIGVTSQALAAGRPQVCVPFAHDQRDNAHRVVRLGAGISLPARRLTARRLARAIRNAPARLSKSQYEFTTRNFGENIRSAVTELI